MKNSGQPLLRVYAIIVVALTIQGCTKAPVAMFSTTDSSYYAGELIVLSNTSTGATTYIWTLPDGTTQESEHLSYQTTANDIGELSFSLTAYTENGKKSDTYTASVTVQEALGEVMFWSPQHSAFAPVEVTIDSALTEFITQYSFSEPECGHQDAANFSGLSEGVHHYRATDGARTWNSVVYITAGRCEKIMLEP